MDTHFGLLKAGKLLKALSRHTPGRFVESGRTPYLPSRSVRFRSGGHRRDAGTGREELTLREPECVAYAFEAGSLACRSLGSSRQAPLEI